MKTFHRILACSDLSAASKNGIDRALMLAGQHGARLHLIHTLSDTSDFMAAEISVDMESLRNEIASHAKAMLEKQLLSAPHYTAAQAADTHIAWGRPGTAIPDFADQHRIDLVVLAAKGEGLIRHMLFGTTAARLLKRMTRPMLVVKQHVHEPYRKILIPVDFSAYSTTAIRYAQLIAPNAELVLIHAFEVAFEGKLQYAGIEQDVIHRYRIAAREKALQKLLQLMAANGLDTARHSALVFHGDPSQQIILQEQEQSCDLIVLGKHGASFIEELLLGSVTKHVLAESQSDILVVPRDL